MAFQKISKAILKSIVFLMFQIPMVGHIFSTLMTDLKNHFNPNLDRFLQDITSLDWMSMFDFMTCISLYRSPLFRFKLLCMTIVCISALPFSPLQHFFLACPCWDVFNRVDSSKSDGRLHAPNHLMQTCVEMISLMSAPSIFGFSLKPRCSCNCIFGNFHYHI